MKKKNNKSNFFRKIVIEHPFFRLVYNNFSNLFSFLGNIFCIFSITIFFFVVLLVLDRFKLFDFLKNDIIKACIFGLCSLIISPIVSWRIQNKISLREKLFLDNFTFFEELTEELNKIFIKAVNKEFVTTTDLLSFIEKNKGKLYIILPSKLLDNIDLLLKECNEYQSQNFTNIKIYTNKCMSDIGKFVGNGKFTYFYKNFHFFSKDTVEP